MSVALPPELLAGHANDRRGARVVQVAKPKFERILLRSARELIHEAFEREDVRVSAERAKRGNAQRHVRNEMMNDARVRKVVERNRVAVAAAFRLRQRLRWRRRERLLQVGRGEQVARLPRPRRMRVAPYVELPFGDGSRRIEPRADRLDHRGTERLPRVLVFAHPLDAHRPAGHRAREQRGIRRDVVGAIVPIATGALHVDAVDALLRHPQHFGERVAQRIYALTMRPYGVAAVVELRNRARRPDRTMELIRPQIGRFDWRAAAGKSAAIQNRRVARGQCLHRLEERVHCRQHRLLVPSRSLGERTHRADRLVFARGDHRQKAAVADDGGHARQPLHRPFIDVAQRRRRARRPHDATVDHAVEPKVLNVGDAAGDLGRNVDAFHRRADDFVTGRIAHACRSGRLHVQRHSGDERAVAERAAVPAAHDAVRRVEPLWRNPPLRRSALHQQLAHARGCVANGGAAVLYRMAAGCVPLVGGALGVGGDDGNPHRIDRQFFRRHLDQRRLDALPKLGLAGEHRDTTVALDANPGVDVRLGLEAAG